MAILYLKAFDLFQYFYPFRFITKDMAEKPLALSDSISDFQTLRSKGKRALQADGP